MKLFRKREGGGSTGFHISYSELHICIQKYGQSFEKGFHKSSTGGRGHRFMKLFHKIPLFLNDGFPKWYETKCPTIFLSNFILNTDCNLETTQEGRRKW